MRSGDESDDDRWAEPSKELIRSLVYVPNEEQPEPQGEEPTKSHAGVVALVVKSDPRLNNCERREWLKKVEKAWLTPAQRHLSSAYFYQALEASGDPYLLTLYMIANSIDFYKCKHNTFPLFVIDTFAAWAKDTQLENFHILTFEDKRDALSVILKQNNIQLVKKVVGVYQIHKDREMFVEHIRNLSKEHKFDLACRCASHLQLYEQFTLEEFLVALVLQDKMNLVEEYVQHSSKLQKELVLFLDKHIPQPEALSLMADVMNLKDVKRYKFEKKTLGKLTSRLMKRFNIPSDFCPNASRRHCEGGLRYLLYRNYIQKSFGSDNLDELIRLAVRDSAELQEELIWHLEQYDDLEKAAFFALEYDIPPSKIPDRVQPAIDRLLSGTSASETTKTDVPYVEGNWDELVAPLNFYKFKLSLNAIRLVENYQDFSNFIQAVSKECIIGVDAEWRPTFGVDQTVASLLQVATMETVFLLDIVKLGNLQAYECHQLETQVFSNPCIVKLGYGLREDLNVLSRSLPGLERLRENTTRILDVSSLWDHIRQKFPSLIPNGDESSVKEGAKGLSEVVRRCFGAPLDKSEQFSDWGRRPLRPSQLLYAALDAYCLLEVYNYFRSEAEKKEIPLRELILELEAGRSVKQKSRHRRGSRGTEQNVYRGNGRGRNLNSGVPGSEPSDLEVTLDAEAIKTPADIRFVCDTMVQKLGKMLRMCGFDTVILGSNADHDDCVQLALREGRVILSRGSIAIKLAKYVRRGNCVSLKTDNPEEQLEYVFNMFNIQVTDKHIFTRCQTCNSNSFHVIDKQVMREIAISAGLEVSLSPKPVVEEFTVSSTRSHNRHWQIVTRSINHEQGLTAAGKRIQIKQVPVGVLNTVKTFYVCNNCGKCYWDGTHFQRVLKGYLGKILSSSQNHSVVA